MKLELGLCEHCTFYKDGKFTCDPVPKSLKHKMTIRKMTAISECDSYKPINTITLEEWIT